MFTQSVILSSGNSGIICSVLVNDNSEIMTFKSLVSFTTLLLSGSKFSLDKNYKIVTTSNVNNASDFNGLYLTGTFSNFVLLSSFTFTSTITKIEGHRYWDITKLYISLTS